jgi:hypothetical protein
MRHILTSCRRKARKILCAQPHWRIFTRLIKHKVHERCHRRKAFRESSVFSGPPRIPRTRIALRGPSDGLVQETAAVSRRHARSDGQPACQSWRKPSPGSQPVSLHYMRKRGLHRGGHRMKDAVGATLCEFKRRIICEPPQSGLD